MEEDIIISKILEEVWLTEKEIVVESEELGKIEGKDNQVRLSSKKPIIPAKATSLIQQMLNDSLVEKFQKTIGDKKARKEVINEVVNSSFLTSDKITILEKCYALLGKVIVFTADIKWVILDKKFQLKSSISLLNQKKYNVELELNNKQKVKNLDNFSTINSVIINKPEDKDFNKEFIISTKQDKEIVPENEPKDLGEIALEKKPEKVILNAPIHNIF